MVNRKDCMQNRMVRSGWAPLSLRAAIALPPFVLLSVVSVGSSAWASPRPLTPTTDLDTPAIAEAGTASPAAPSEPAASSQSGHRYRGGALAPRLSQTTAVPASPAAPSEPAASSQSGHRHRGGTLAPRLSQTEATPQGNNPSTAEATDGDVFSPLPGVEDTIPSPATPNPPQELAPPEPVPAAPAGAAAPIPERRVLDNLEYMNPDPNPLLLPTQPQEVEIIGNQPLTLEEAIELSYRNNPDLQVALLQLEQSRAALREVQAGNLPTISINGALQAQNTTTSGGSSLVPNASGGFDFVNETNEELGLALSAQVDVVYRLFTSGRREASIQAAEEQVRLQELEVERRREELRLNTANEYYDLQAAVEAIRISEAFLEQAERNLKDTSLREEVGVGTRFDVLRAQVQVANARQDLVNSRRAREVAQRVLARRLNVPPSLTISTMPVEVAGSWPLSLEESIVLALQNRAELEQQLVRRDLNEQLRIAELAALKPQVDLFANYSLSTLLNQDNGLNDNYQLGARLSWQLYDGGAAEARARQRELDIEVAGRNFEETRNTVRLAVERAYFNLQSNLANIETADFAVVQAREALRLAELRFEAGVGTQLDILDAQSQLTDAEVNLVQAKVGYNRSLAEMQRAVSNLPPAYYEDLAY